MELAMYIVWPVIMVLAIIIEVQTSQQIGWSAMIAAAAALIVHGFKGDLIWPEFLTFFVSWVLLWILLWFLLWKNKLKMEDQNDGYFEFIGKKAKVISFDKEEDLLEAKLGNKIFRIISKTKNLKVGDIVIVKKIKGVTLIVEKEKK